MVSQGSATTSLRYGDLIRKNVYYILEFMQFWKHYGFTR